MTEQEYHNMILAELAKIEKNIASGKEKFYTLEEFKRYSHNMTQEYLKERQIAAAKTGATNAQLAHAL
jgi:hypothetical protein